MIVILRNLIAGLAMLAAAPLARAQTAIDGDTVDYKGVVVHLWGIDAPENGQVCTDGWEAGQESRAALARLLRAGSVECRLQGGDSSGHVAAVCTAAGKDLAAVMVRTGMAWAQVRETEAYVVQEAEAMSAVRGVHAHSCEKAWEWRAKHDKKH
ncbi:MAG: thermonuclease family protein [Proteobacteria bacterium]|nr:thermonuclease family protein [Pseudomonadota bacterium]MBS0548813.1 thermonuclease family protein [Pseudomonadota bacterium]